MTTYLKTSGEPYDPTYEELIHASHFGGLVVLEDGTELVREAEVKIEREPAPHTAPAYNKPFVSESLGCHPLDIAEHRDEARRAGFSAVDFKIPQDGNNGETMAVCEISCPRQYREYIKWRGFRDQNTTPVMLSDKELERAKESVIAKYGPPK